MFWALCADTHRGGVQPLCSSAPEPGVEPLPLPEQSLSWCIFSVFAPTIADAVPLPRSRRGGCNGGIFASPVAAGEVARAASR